MPHGDDHQNHDGEFEGRTYLYIRTHPADSGSEPLPGGLAQWISPDITIIQPGGARGTEAVANQTNQVEVVVTNLGGLPATDAYVDVFFADPSTTFTPATATLIGGGYLSIPGYSLRVITFPWVPSTADAGHRCLVARVALYLPPDTYVDGSIFDVRGDRHVAQRNINVVSLGDREAMSFSFAIVNPFPDAMQMRLVVNEVREAREQQLLRQGLGCDFAQFGESPLATIKLDLGKERREVAIPDNPMLLLDTPHRLARSGPLDGVRPDNLRNSLIVDMKPGEICEGLVYVERNPDTRPGDVHAVNVTQYDPNRNVVGGLTLVVRH